MRRRVALAVLLAPLLSSLAADWPMFRGPEVNGISHESGWSPTWPKDGPPVRWRAKVGLGFSTVVVSQGKLIATGHDGRARGRDTIWCLDAVTGKELWKHTYAAPLGNKYFEGGATGTPTIDGGRVYHLAREGDFFCLDLATGKVVYQRQLAKELGVEVPEWGFAASPLVQGELLILNIGSHGAALDRATGKTVWQNGKGPAAYATPVPCELDGARCVALLGHREVAVVECAGGKIRWRTKFETGYDTSATAPVLHDGALVVGGYNIPAVKLNLRDGSPAAGWKTDTRIHFNSGVVLGGHLYTFHGEAGKAEGELRCLDWGTGATRWAQKGLGVGSLLAAAEKLVVLSEAGELLVLAANPQKFEPIARAHVLGRKCWISPVLAGGRLFLRNVPGDLVCVEVSGR